MALSIADVLAGSSEQELIQELDSSGSVALADFLAHVKTPSNDANLQVISAAITAAITAAEAQVRALLQVSISDAAIDALVLDFAVYRCYGRAITETVEKRYQAAMAQIRGYNANFRNAPAANSNAGNSNEQTGSVEIAVQTSGRYA